MKVATRFSIIIVSLTAVIISAGILIYENTRIMDKEIERREIGNLIRKELFELVALRDEYRLYSHERILDQHKTVGDRIDSHIESALFAFTDKTDRKTLLELQKKSRSMGELFSEVVLYAKKHQGGAGSTSESFEERLIGQLGIASQSAISLADTLVESVQNRITNLQKLATLQILAFTAALIIALLVSVWIVWLRIVRRIIELKKGSEIIAGGDFTYSFSDPSKDELGQLSSAMNEMAARLNASYEKLEDEVSRRTKELLKTRDSLELKVFELETAKKAVTEILRDLGAEKGRIEEANVHNEAILTSMEEGFIATDRDERIIMLNPKAEKLLLWDKKDAVGQRLEEVLTVRTESGETVSHRDSPIPRALATKEPLKADLRYVYVRKDGSALPVELSAAPIFLKGRVIGAINVFRDATEAREVERSKSEFISVAAHQLRTPAAAMNWYLERLRSGKVGTLTLKQAEYFSEIEENNHRMIKLVNTLLNVSRLEMGAFSNRPIAVNVQEVLQKGLKELRPLIEKKSLVVEEEYDLLLGKVSFGPELLNIVITNLLTNAINYTPAHGFVRVKARSLKAGETFEGETVELPTVMVVVSDSGYGIPSNQHNQLFTKFFRATNARTRLTDGNGLGLYIVKSILDQAGGSIRFSSEENKGTTFYVALPVAGSATAEFLKMAFTGETIP